MIPQMDSNGKFIFIDANSFGGGSGSIDGNIVGEPGNVPYVNEDGNKLKVESDFRYFDSQNLLKLLGYNGSPFCNGSLSTECYNVFGDQESCDSFNGCSWYPDGYCSNYYSDPACYGTVTLDCTTLDQSTCENYPAYYDCYWDGSVCQPQGYSCDNMSGDYDACTFFGCDTEVCYDFSSQNDCDTLQQSGLCYWEDYSYCDGYLTCNQPTQTDCDNVFNVTGECFWDVNGQYSKVWAGQLKSDANYGDAPLEVDSNTMVANLNANFLNGFLASAFALASTAITGSGTANGIAYFVNGQAIASDFLEIQKNWLGSHDQFLIKGVSGGTARMGFATLSEFVFGTDTATDIRFRTNNLNRSKIDGSTGFFQYGFSYTCTAPFCVVDSTGNRTSIYTKTQDNSTVHNILTENASGHNRFWQMANGFVGFSSSGVDRTYTSTFGGQANIQFRSWQVSNSAVSSFAFETYGSPMTSYFKGGVFSGLGNTGAIWLLDGDGRHHVGKVPATAVGGNGVKGTDGAYQSSIYPDAVGTVGERIKLIANQTADAFQVQKSDANVLYSVGKDGNIFTVADLNVNNKFKIKPDGNFLMTSPDLNTWNCGVDNLGNVRCS